MNRQLIALASRTLGDADHREQQDALSVEGRLRELAFNLWWNWHPQVLEMFRELDHRGWADTNHNPIALLKRFAPGSWPAGSPKLSLENRVSFHYRRLQEYLTSDAVLVLGAGGRAAGDADRVLLRRVRPARVAAALLRRPRRPGRRLPEERVGPRPADGRRRPVLRERLLPPAARRARAGSARSTASPTSRRCRCGGRSAATARPSRSGSRATARRSRRGSGWRRVGRTLLLLLDSDVEQNPPHLRGLTGRLYGGDEVTRIRQEILLGVGGLRALRALGLRPAVLHLNEGHSAFAMLERARERVEEDGLGVRGGPARDVAADGVHHAHAGRCRPRSVLRRTCIERELGWLRSALEIDHDRLMRLGRVNPNDAGEPFCMTVLSLRGSRYRNGVSSLHGHVARRMWTGRLAGSRRRGDADRPHHQRGPRPLVARAVDEPAVRPLPRRRLARPPERVRGVAADRVDRRRRVVGDARRAAAVPDRVRPPAERAAGPARPGTP